MKVSELIKILQNDHSPDEEIFAMWWEKRNFDYEDDAEVVLTDDSWREICSDLEKWDNAGHDITEWISSEVSEHAQLKKMD